MRWNNRWFGKGEDLAPCLRRVTSLLLCRSLQLPWRSCTVPAPSTGCACSSVTGTEMPVSPLSAFPEGRVLTRWLCQHLDFALGCRIWAVDQVSQEKNCSKSRLHFAERVCGSINGGLGWRVGWRENGGAMWRLGESVDGRGRNRLRAMVPPLCVGHTVPVGVGENITVGNWEWGDLWSGSCCPHGTSASRERVVKRFCWTLGTLSPPPVLWSFVKDKTALD